MTNTDALKKLLHFIWNLLDDELQAMIEVIGEAIDAVETDIDYIIEQMDPREADSDGSLPDFERFYQLTPGGGDTVAVRRARVVAAIRSKGGLYMGNLENIAGALGYSIGSGTKYLSIVEGEHDAFRADYGRADLDAVYDQDVGSSVYDVTVLGTDVETDNDLQAMFEKNRTAGINFIYENV